MPRCAVLLSLLFLCPIPSLGQTQSPSEGRGPGTTPQMAKVITVDPDSAYAKGVWRPDNPTKKNELLEAITELSCFRRGGRALVGTEAFCLQITAMVIDSTEGMVDVSTAWLKVIEWSQTQIIASDDTSICVTSQTIFDLKRKNVIALDVRKPEAQGLRGACNLIPDRQTYYLQDPPDYYATKSSNK